LVYRTQRGGVPSQGSQNECCVVRRGRLSSFFSQFDDTFSVNLPFFQLRRVENSTSRGYCSRAVVGSSGFRRGAGAGPTLSNQVEVSAVLFDDADEEFINPRPENPGGFWHGMSTPCRVFTGFPACTA
jgi:hypothetical protein